MTPTFNRRELLAAGGAAAAFAGWSASAFALGSAGVPAGAIVVHALGGLSNPNADPPERKEPSVMENLLDKLRG